MKYCLGPDKHQVIDKSQQPTPKTNTDDVRYDLYRDRHDYYANRDRFRGDNDDRRALLPDVRDGMDYDWD